MAVAGMNAMEVLEIAVDGWLRMFGFRSDHFGIFLFEDGLSDNGGFMGNPGAKVLQATAVRQRRGMLFFPG